MVPGLLALVARDLLLYDPPRVLAWRVLHDPGTERWPAVLRALLPHPPAGLDRDPVALVLGALALGLAIAYLAAGLLGARPRVRAALLGLGALVVVVLPTAAFVALGQAAGRPYGQDGGVVQLPLALGKIASGQSPYAADYSDSILGKEARVSGFWAPYGGNPILRHHAYLPGTHLLMAPAWLLLGRAFDPRLVTLAFYVAAALLATLLVAGTERRLAAAAVILVNPLLYWPQVFGANDIVCVALLLGAAVLGRRGRPLPAAAVLGLACATKQLAWPFAPFLLLALAQARTGSLREAARRLVLPVAAAGAVFLAVVLPVAALDFRAFWADIVVYNAGLPGGDNYPLGGTPGFGIANFVIYGGWVGALGDYVPLSRLYVLLVPLGLLLLRRQLREGDHAAALVHGSLALLASVYLSRVVHANYLVLAAALLPLAVLAGARLAADAVLAPLLLLGLAVELSQGALLRSTWEDAVAVRLPAHLGGVAAALAPRAGPGLTQDPLGLLFSALAAGFGLLYLTAGVLEAGGRLRRGIAVLALAVVVALPTAVVAQVGARAGVARLQDRWAVSLGGRPAAAREAWSQSFRKDPPAAFDLPGVVSPAQAVLAAAAQALGDPRWLTLAALAAALLLAVRTPGPTGALLAAVLCAPPLAVGVVFGASDALMALAALAAAAAGGARRPTGAGLAVGLGAALVPRALTLSPLVGGGTSLRPWLACLAGFAVLALPSLAGALPAGPGPIDGLGLPNLLLYWGVSGPAGPLAVLALLALAACSLAALTRGGPPAGWAALALLTWLWLVPAAPAHALGAPLVLLALAAAGP